MTKAKTSKGSSPAPKASKGPPATAMPLVDRLLSRLPHLTDIQRTAFRGQFTHAQCDDLGTRTKGEAVHREALAWASLIDGTLRKHSKAVRRYTEARFAWLLQCIRDLGEALEAQRAAHGSAGASKKRVERARASAVSARDELLSILSTLAGGDATEREALAKATGTAETPATLARSLNALADLADDWLSRETDAAKVLTASVALRPGDVESARAAADALTSATGDKALSGSSAPRDLPTVNRAEGRVLLEMRVAMRLFERANAESKVVPRLVPGAATRRVLAVRKGADEAADETKGSGGAATEAPEDDG